MTWDTNGFVIFTSDLVKDFPKPLFHVIKYLKKKMEYHKSLKRTETIYTMLGFEY